MIKQYGSIENYAKSIKKFRHFRKIAIKRRITFAAKQGLPNACKRIRKSSKGPIEDEENELFKEFGIAVCEKIPMPSFHSPDATPEDNEYLGRPWNMLYQMYMEGERYESNPKFVEDVHATRTLVVMHFCIVRSIWAVLEVVKSGVEYDEKRATVREIAHGVCKNLLTWFGEASKNMENLLKTLNQRVNGMLDNPHVNHAIFSNFENFIQILKDMPMPKFIPTRLSVSISSMHQLIVQEFVNEKHPEVNDGMANDDGGSKDQEEDQGHQEPVVTGVQVHMDEDDDEWLNALLINI